VSKLIRPATLSVRLTANITSGHLVMALVLATAVTALVTAVVTVLICLELGIAVIQGFVFTLLSSVYVQEA
jgi:F-type H+-transporting ATPase subunit a